MYKIYAAILAATTLTACQDEITSSGSENNTNQGIIQETRFSTAESYQLNINYDTDVTGVIPFEIYDQTPFKDGVKRSDLLPIYSGITTVNGTYNHSIDLPEYISAPGQNLYIYTSCIHVPSLLIASINGNAINVDRNNIAMVKSHSTRSGEPTTSALQEGWVKMGNYNENGVIEYADGIYKEKDLEEAYNIFNNYYGNLKKKQNTNEHKDITFDCSNNKKLAVTLLSSNSEYNSSLGYYYYSEGKEPTYEELVENGMIHLLFPNTQDGDFDCNEGSKSTTVGTQKGTTVYLKYYNGKDDKTGSYYFPGTKINVGFVLLSNAWSEKLINDNNQTRTSTNTTISKDRYGKNITNNGSMRRPVLAFKYYSGKGLDGSGNFGKAFVAFEDNFIQGKNNGNEKDVNDYTDVVILLTTVNNDDIDAPWIDEVTPETPVHRTMTKSGGLFSFEDLWPSRGDFDMNDVLVRYDYSIDYMEAKMGELTEGKPFKLISEEFVLTPGQNINAANNKNGFGICLKTERPELNSSNCDIEYYISVNSVLDKDGNFVDCQEYKEFTPAQGLHNEKAYRSDNIYNVILVTNNIKGNDVLNHHIKFVVKYKEAIEITDGERDGVSTLNPFIYKQSENNPEKRWEVHLTNRIPTENVDDSYFGTEDDASIPEENIYYVRKVNSNGEITPYPFSFYLLGVPSQDAYENLREKLVYDKNGNITGTPKNERTSIDKVFNRYMNWVRTDHNEDKDWYLEK